MLRLDAGTLAADSYTPAGLKYSLDWISQVPSLPPPDVDVVKVGNVLRQVKSPESLADIVTLSPTSYEVRYYLPSQVGAKVGGFYPVSGSPSVTWRFELPAGGVVGRNLRITEIRNGITTARDYATDATGDSWTMTQAGVRQDSSVRTTLTGGDRQTLTTVTDLARNEVVSQRKEVRHTFDWGDETILTVEDLNGAVLTTAFSFYEDALQPGQYGRLKSVLHHDGSWEKYIYHEPTIGDTNASTAGLVKYVMRPWLDNPVSSNAATAQNCRVTEYGYQAGAFDYDLKSEPLFEEETILGVVTAHRDFAVDETVLGRSQQTTVFADATKTQSSANSQFSAAYPWPATSRPDSLVNTDHTEESSTYEGGSYDAATGVFTAGVGGAVRAILVRKSNESTEVAFKSVRTVTVNDARGRIALEEDHVFTDSDTSPMRTRKHDYRPSGKLKQTTENGRIIHEEEWSGDRLVSETDEQGVGTTYSNFDGMGRPQTMMRAGVSATTGYDALGRKRSVTHSGGGLTVASGTGYDVAGRLLSETDEDGLTTGYGYSTDGRTTTVTHPNGATTITATFLDGQTKSITGTAQVAQYFHPTVEASTGYRKLRVYSGTDLSARWVETTADWVGRPIVEEHPSQAGTVTQNWSYNTLGQLEAGQRTGTAATLSQYDTLGRPSRRGIDLDNDTILVPGSMDRYEETDMRFEQAGGEWHEVHESWTYLADNDATTTTLRTTHRELTGLPTGTMSDVTGVDARGQATHVVETVNRATATATRTTTLPGSTLAAVAVMTNGRAVSSSSTTVAAAVNFQYDGLGRLWKTTDPRTDAVVETRTYYPGTNQLNTVATPVGTTTYAWYPNADANAGSLKSVTGPDATVTRHAYNSRGQLVRTWGSATYPVETIYDSLGQQTGMRTFRTEQGWNGANWPSSSSGDLTQWSYNPGGGELTSKTDAANKTVSYMRAITITGATLTRTWARTVAGGGALTATVSYNFAGDLTGVDYSDATPDVTIEPDRIGRPRTVTDGSGTRTRTHHADGALESETFTAGVLNGLVMTRTPDAVGRLGGITLASGAANLLTQDYGYDPAKGRMQSASQGQVGTTLSYVENSDLALETAFAYSSATRMTTTRSYDTAGRLKSIASQRPIAAQPVSATGYEFDLAGRRKRQLMADGTAWDYGYNDRGEVTGASRKWADASAVAGQQYGYGFDAIGNRTSATVNGRAATYAPNNLNQYDSRGVPGYVDMIGKADAAAAVTVNGAAATRQSGGYFHKEVAVANGSAGAWPAITTRATQGAVITEQTGHRWLPSATETFTHDFDGNLTSDGRWNYTWDAENRLVRIETRTGLPAGMPRVRVDHTYDYRSRRVRTVASLWNGSAWVAQRDARFIYSGGWNLIAELDAANAPIRTQLWGNDLSGSAEGAGGVGGLLCVMVHQATPANLTGAYLPSYDGNGNIIALVKASDGTQAATYEYGAFGELLRMTGAAARLNPWRFSTKYQDEETGLVMYQLRPYQPATGRWLSRDPIGENGGINLLQFVSNDPMNRIDPFGLWEPVKRDSNKTLTTVHSDSDSDTWESLARVIGLRGSEASMWVTGYEEKPRNGCAYQVPNTIVAHWAGDLSGLGMAAVGWDKRIAELRGKGFQVADSISQKGRDLALQKNMESHSRNRTLHGLLFQGHGN